MTGGQAARRRPARSVIGVGRTRVPLGGFYAGILLLLYLPIVILFVFSFSANTRLSFPLQGFTLDWYADVLADPSLIGAARNSLIVAAAAATAATLLGALVIFAAIAALIIL
jgi:spermidine/putrescine transport system permease protein